MKFMQLRTRLLSRLWRLAILSCVIMLAITCGDVREPPYYTGGDLDHLKTADLPGRDETLARSVGTLSTKPPDGFAAPPSDGSTESGEVVAVSVRETSIHGIGGPLPCSRRSCGITLTFHNLTDRAIRAISGSIDVSDVFGARLVRFELTYTRGITPHSESSVKYIWQSDELFSLEDIKERDEWESAAMRLKDAQPSDLSVDWFVATVLFKDGGSKALFKNNGNKDDPFAGIQLRPLPTFQLHRAN